ncbi:MAG: 3-oxoacyl-ACP synthase, partial [Pseudomonadota bacterium]
SAAGALEMACVIAAIQHETVPPTARIETVDDLHGLDPTPITPRKRVIRRALSNSFAFGGHNSVLAISAP